MEKKDLYLSDEQIYAVAKPYADGGFWVVDYDRAISNASADYAVKKVIEWVNEELIESDSRNMWYLNKRFWEALKKLIET